MIIIKELFIIYYMMVEIGLYINVDERLLVKKFFYRNAHKLVVCVYLYVYVCAFMCT